MDMTQFESSANFTETEKNVMRFAAALTPTPAEVSGFMEEEREAACYICGLPAMMESVTADLKALQIAPDRIYSEEFLL